MFKKHLENQNFTSDKSNGWRKLHSLGLNCTIDLSKIEKRLRLGFDISTGLKEESIFQGQLSLGMSLV